MLLATVSHLLCAWFAFALPSYATYKALAHSAPADTLQALAKYWAVVGAFVALEQTLGLLFSWLPFYWELRTIFLLYIALPQTQGSAYVYDTYFEPWCSKNESDLDAAMVSAQSNATAFGRSRVTALVNLVWRLLDKTPPNGNAHKSASPADQLEALWAAFAPKDPSEAHISNGEPYSTN